MVEYMIEIIVDILKMTVAISLGMSITFGVALFTIKKLNLAIVTGPKSLVVNELKYFEGVKEIKATKEQIISFVEKGESTKDKYKELLGQIGKKPVSWVLIGSRVLALEEGDERFLQWINFELNGYPTPDKGSQIGELYVYYPPYRRIKSEITFRLNDGSLKPIEIPTWFPYNIKEVEKMLREYEKNGDRKLSTKIPFGNNWPELVKNKEIPVIIPHSALKQINNGVEKELGEFIEKKIRDLSKYK